MLVSEGTRAQLVSRNLKDLTSDYPHLAAAAKSVTREPVILDGELVAIDDQGLPSFQALQHRSVKRTAVVFYVFDLLHLGTTDYRRRPLAERRAALDRLTFKAPILRSQPLPGTTKQIERSFEKPGSRASSRSVSIRPMSRESAATRGSR